MRQKLQIPSHFALAILALFAGCQENAAPTIDIASQVNVRLEESRLNYSLEVPVESAQQFSNTEPWVEFRFSLTDHDGLHTYRQWTSRRRAVASKSDEEITLIAKAQGSIKFDRPLSDRYDTLVVLMFVEEETYGTAVRSRFRTPDESTGTHNGSVNRSTHLRGN